MDGQSATDRLVAGFNRINEAGQGILSVFIVRPDDFPLLLAEAETGRAEAEGLIIGLVNNLRQITEAAPRNPVLCLCCPRPIRDPYRITFAFMAPDLPSREAIGMAICRRCAKGAGLEARVIKAIKTHLLPDCRKLDITDMRGGRA